MLLFGTGVLCGVVLAGLLAVFQEPATLDDDSDKAIAMERYRDAAATYCEAVKANHGSGTAWNQYLKARESFLASFTE